MKSLYLLVLCAAIAGTTLSQERTGKPPFTLNLSPAESTVTQGAEIWVTIKCTNTSDRELSTNAYIQKDTNLDLNYLFDFRDDLGHPVPKRIHKFPEGTLYDAVFGTLKPGQSVTNEAHLRWLYDLDRPGKYKLQVSRRVPKELGGGIVKSNTITITVTDKKDDSTPKQ